MALIKCSECGQMVSDKAEACPHCGCPVGKPMACPECGQVVSEGNTYCLKCGCPLGKENHQPGYKYQETSQMDETWEDKEPSNSGKWLWISLAALALLAIGGTTFWLNSSVPVEDTVAVVEEIPMKYSVEGVVCDLLNCSDEAAAIALLDRIKINANKALNSGDQESYFNIINILNIVWDNNKDAIVAKFPSLSHKMPQYLKVPDELKADFATFSENAAKEAIESVDALEYIAETAVNDDVVKEDTNDDYVDADIEEVKSWIQGNWRYRMVTEFGPMEMRVGISGDYIVVMTNGEMHYNGEYTIDGDCLYYNSSNGASDVIYIDRTHRRLMVTQSEPMTRF